LDIQAVANRVMTYHMDATDAEMRALMLDVAHREGYVTDDGELTKEECLETLGYLFANAWRKVLPLDMRDYEMCMALRLDNNRKLHGALAWQELILIRLQERKPCSAKEEKEAEYRSRAELALYLLSDRTLETAAEKALEFSRRTNFETREYYRSLKWAQNRGMVPAITDPQQQRL
jgi:hypothetical protein